jgi:hypothetical protein
MLGDGCGRSKRGICRQLTEERVSHLIVLRREVERERQLIQVEAFELLQAKHSDIGHLQIRALGQALLHAELPLLRIRHYTIRIHERDARPRLREFTVGRTDRLRNPVRERIRQCRGWCGAAVRRPDVGCA